MAATALLATGCVNEDPAYKNNEPGTPPDPNAKGYLTLADMSMRVVVDTDTETQPDDTSDETAKPTTRAEEAQPDVDAYIVEIRDASGKQVLKETYGNLMVSIGEAGRLELPVGSYTMEVRSEEAATTPAAEWERPVYFGSQEFIIEKNRTTSIDEVVCTLNNIKVTLMCSKDLADQLTDDTKSTGLAGRNDDDLPEERNPRGLLHAAGRDQHAQITPRRRFRPMRRRTRPDQQEHLGRQGRTMAQTIHRDHLLGQGRHQTGHRRRRLRGGRRNPGQRSRQPGRTRTSRRPDPRMSRLRPHETLPASGLDVRRPGQLHPAVRL